MLWIKMFLNQEDKTQGRDTFKCSKSGPVHATISPGQTTVCDIVTISGS